MAASALVALAPWRPKQPLGGVMGGDRHLGAPRPAVRCRTQAAAATVRTMPRRPLAIPAFMAAGEKPWSPNSTPATAAVAAVARLTPARMRPARRASHSTTAKARVVAARPRLTERLTSA